MTDTIDTGPRAAGDVEPNRPAEQVARRDDPPAPPTAPPPAPPRRGADKGKPAAPKLPPASEGQKLVDTLRTILTGAASLEDDIRQVHTALLGPPKSPAPKPPDPEKAEVVVVQGLFPALARAVADLGQRQAAMAEMVGELRRTF